MMDIMTADTSTLPAIGAAIAAVLAALVAYVLPGAFSRFPLKSRSEACFWAGVCVGVSRRSAFARATGLFDLLSIDGVAADGTLSARFRISPPISNTMHSLHGGAAALIVDELTTASIMARRCHPGVTISLSLQYINGCPPGGEVVVTSRVTRQGRIICHTDTEFRRAEDGAVMIRASHVKYVVPPSRLWGLLLNMRTSVARRVVPLAGIAVEALPSPSAAAGAASCCSPAAAAAAAAADAAAFNKEPPFTDPEKKEYYRTFATSQPSAEGGEGGKDTLRFFDRSFAAAGLRSLGGGAYELARPKAGANPSGALHGGCTASLVDVLGSAAIAAHPENTGDSCGVATNLDVTYGAPGRGGPITFTTEVPKIGGRLATAVVVAKDPKGRLVARGTVTKYGKLR